MSHVPDESSEIFPPLQKTDGTRPEDTKLRHPDHAPGLPRRQIIEQYRCVLERVAAGDNNYHGLVRLEIGEVPQAHQALGAGDIVDQARGRR
uniref:Uncharacterized protein n=1 Tax=Oryza barthii TaxID=65489 RepID=A0A0D3HMK9_9ORYZ